VRAEPQERAVDQAHSTSDGAIVGNPRHGFVLPLQTSKLQGIEAARGVAAILVVLRHSSAILSEPASYGIAAFAGLFAFGRAGVEFFFVLSGFIIAYVHAGDIGRPAGFLPFWRKRVLRVYPPYWIATAALCLLLVVSPTRGLAERDPLHIVLSLLLLPESQEPILGVGWSLRHELLFYLLFSLAVLHRLAGAVLLACWGSAVVGAAVYSAWTGERLAGGALSGLVLRVFNLEFFFGLAVAWFVLRCAPWRPVAVLVTGALLFLANGIMESFAPGVQPEQLGLTLVYALASSMVLYGLAVLDRAKVARVPRVLVQLGGASYSIYLVHIIVILILGFALRPFRGWLPLGLAFVLCSGVAVLGGLVFSHFIERPVLRLGRKAEMDRPVPAGEAGSSTQ